MHILPQFEHEQQHLLDLQSRPKRGAATPSASRTALQRPILLPGAFRIFKILTALSARPSAQRAAECGSHVDSYLARAPLIRRASRTTRRARATPAERRWSSPPPVIRHLPTTDQWSMRTLCAHPNTSSRRQTERAASCYCLPGPRQLPSPHRPLGQYIWHLLSCPSLHSIRTQLRCTRCPGRATSGC